MLEKGTVTQLPSGNYDYSGLQFKNTDATINLKWEISASRWKTYHFETKGIFVICSSDGAIQVKGERNYLLQFKDWSNNPGLQENVLEKAYRNPMSLVPIPSSHVGPNFSLN